MYILISDQQLMQELSGGGPAPNGEAPQRIEAGTGGYENGHADGYGDGDRDVKPWQRGPTGAAAPWQRPGDDQGRRDDYASHDGGSAPPWAAAAPWQQQGQPPQQSYGGYGGYPGYGDANGGYPTQQGMGAPPGLGGNAGGLGAPPGLGALFQQYNQNGSGSPAPPPPPPPSDFPPPPVSYTSNSILESLLIAMK